MHFLVHVFQWPDKHRIFTLLFTMATCVGYAVGSRYNYKSAFGLSLWNLLTINIVCTYKVELEGQKCLLYLKTHMTLAPCPTPTHYQQSSGAFSGGTQSHLLSTQLPSHFPNVQSIYGGWDYVWRHSERLKKRIELELLILHALSIEFACI